MTSPHAPHQCFAYVAYVWASQTMPACNVSYGRQQIKMCVCQLNAMHVQGLLACPSQGPVCFTQDWFTVVEGHVYLHRVLRGHRGSVITLCSMGGLLLSGGRDNVVRVWDMDALVCRRTLVGHKDDVLCIAGLRLQPPSSLPPDLELSSAPTSSQVSSPICSLCFSCVDGQVEASRCISASCNPPSMP